MRQQMTCLFRININVTMTTQLYEGNLGDNCRFEP